MSKRFMNSNIKDLVEMRENQGIGKFNPKNQMFGSNPNPLFRYFLICTTEAQASATSTLFLIVSFLHEVQTKVTNTQH